MMRRNHTKDAVRDVIIEVNGKMLIDLGHTLSVYRDSAEKVEQGLKRLDDRLWSMSPRETIRGVPSWFVRSLKDGISFKYPLYGAERQSSSPCMEITRNGPEISITFTEYGDSEQHRWTLRLEQDL